MIVIRDVFQARYGRGSDLVNHFKEARSQWDAGYGTRILTDLSGQFFTVVIETEVESLATWEQRTGEIFGQPGFGAWFGRMTELVESGKREFYTLER